MKIISSFSMLSSLRNNVSHLENRSLASYAIENTGVVYGYILLRNNLNDLLCYDTSRQRRNIMQLATISPFKLKQDIPDPLL